MANLLTGRGELDYCIVCDGSFYKGGVFEPPDLLMMIVSGKKRNRGFTQVPIISNAHKQCKDNVNRFSKFCNEKNADASAMVNFLKDMAPQGRLYKRLQEVLRGQTEKAATEMGQND